MQTQPSLAGNGAGAELGNWSQIAFKNKHWITKYFIEEKYEQAEAEVVPSSSSVKVMLT